MQAPLEHYSKLFGSNFPCYEAIYFDLSCGERLHAYYVDEETLCCSCCFEHRILGCSMIKFESRLGESVLIKDQEDRWLCCPDSIRRNLLIDQCGSFLSAQPRFRSFGTISTKLVAT